MLLVAACIEKQEAGVPDTVLDGRTVVTADFGSGYTWTGKERISISGSEAGKNVVFMPYASCVGKTGRARLYGGEVKGHLSAYYPYCEDVVGTILQYQSHSSDAKEHLRTNAFMTGESDTDEIVLSFRAGILHVSMSLEIDGEIKSAVLSGAGFPITLYGLSGKCSESSPIDLWFAIEEGEYTGLSLTINSDKETLSKPISGTFVIRAGMINDSKLEDQGNSFGNPDIEEIEGHYDEQ